MGVSELIYILSYYRLHCLSMPGTVYLIRHGTSSIYKIGKTQNASSEKRHRNLTTGNPENLRLVKDWAVHASHSEFERELHLQLATRRVREGGSTEFFDFSGLTEEQIVEIIDDAHTKYEARAEMIQSTNVPQDKADFIKATEETNKLVAEHQRLHNEMKLLQIKCTEVDAQIKMRIGGSSGIRKPDRRRPDVSWKTTISQRFDVQKFKAENPELYARYTTRLEFRTFRVHD